MAAQRGEEAAARRIRQRIVREFHTSHNAYALSLSVIGRFEEAVAMIQEAEAASPFGLSAGMLYNCAQWLLPLGRFEEASQYAARLDGDFAQITKAAIAGAAAQWAVAESLAVSFLDRSDVQPQVFYLRAFAVLASAHAARGRIGAATRTLREGTQLAERMGREPEAQDPRQARLILAATTLPMGPTPRAQALSSSVRGQRLTALWAAWAGDTASAAAYLTSADGQKEPPADGIDADHAQRILLRARLAAVRERWDDVVGLLEPIAEPTFARGEGPAFSQLARWTIAEAHERLGNLDSAATYFELIAQYRGFGDYDQVFRGLTHSVAHRRLALIYTKLDDVDRAEDHWVAFLDNFSDPDPEVRWMVDEARTELERLARGR